MTVTAHHEGALPALPSGIQDAVSTKAALHNLRHFHLGNPEVSNRIQGVTSECLPALLDPFRDARRLRFEYPLFLKRPQPGGGPIESRDLAQPLSEYLAETVTAFAPEGDSARMLKDNLPWLERDLRQRLEGDKTQPGLEGPQPLHPLLGEAAERLLEQLQLDPKSSDQLRGDLERLRAAIPEQGQVMGYGFYPAIHQLIHVIRTLSGPRHERFETAIRDGIRGLSRLLEVEHQKSEAVKAPAHLRSSIGRASGLLDPEALSGLMAHSTGSVSMPPARQERIEQALATLTAYDDTKVRVRFVHGDYLADDSWLNQIPGFEAVSATDPCTEAMRLFDQEAARLGKVFAALRIAHLEIEDIYNPAIHDPWFASFGWEAFSKEELLLVPGVIVLESADLAATSDRASLTRLLCSGRPVQIMIRVQPHNNPAALADEDPFQNYRTELGYIGIAHRQAFVAQTSAARHQHLIKGFLEGLDATRTCMHLISTGLRTTGNETAINAWLVASAGLEGRAHPFFRVNPGKGDSSAECMDFDGNPQAERTWPVHTFRYLDATGATIECETAFTFADYALLMPRLHHHFAVVPPACESNDLIPLAQFLKRPEGDAAQAIPYIWGVDKYGTLQRLVVSRTLVHACRDRLNFWHTLQEMAGVNNRYVEQAEARTRAEVQAQADAERERLVEAHQTALTEARAEAAGEVMGRLTEVLMGMDFSRLPGAPATAPAAEAPARPKPETQAETEAEPQPAPRPEEEQELSFDEAWIDAPLCTSCNDCLAINPVMFVYNDNNQAVIADIAAGTYAQLVEAAEICPSRCIHPGKPLNQGEPNLDDLMQRAAAFN
ncbi:MAG: ferredoxin [gamma proteobacterium symbiont of Phacoides pectinatus]